MDKIPFDLRVQTFRHRIHHTGEIDAFQIFFWYGQLARGFEDFF